MIQQQEMARLRAFHAAHFPGQPIPEMTMTRQQCAAETDPGQVATTGNGDGLGYYEDGVKRTLTDEQIKLFRHSEIQRLLNERRAAREKEEAQKSKKENGRTSHEPRKQRFHDEPSTDHPDVDTLMYDDQPDTQPTSNPSERKFLWPVLGQKAT